MFDTLLGMLSAHFFTKNRNELLNSIEDGLIVMTANGLMQKNADCVYPFRQDSNFYYLTGVTEPDIVLIIDVVSKREFLILPKKSRAEIVFGGSINRDVIAKISGISEILEHKEGWDEVKKLQNIRKSVYTVMPPPVKVVHTDSFFTNGSRRLLLQKLRRNNKHTQFYDLRESLTKLRQIKQPEEIEEIKKAIAITGEALAIAKNNILPGASGYELVAELDYYFAKHGVSHGFMPIVSSGEETCILHNHVSGRNIKTHEPVLFDIGAESNLYSADISRTYFSSVPTKRQQAVYDGVRAVQKYAYSILKDGVQWRDFAKRVEEKMGEELLKLELIKQPTRESIRKYFTHGIGHGLGLDVHDACDYQKISENMVITVEPGIYIPEESLGVRLEDDVRITKTGVEVLSKNIPL